MDKCQFPSPGRHLRGAKPCARQGVPAVAPTGTSHAKGTSLWTTGLLCQQFPQSYAQGLSHGGRSRSAKGLFPPGSIPLRPIHRSLPSVATASGYLASGAPLDALQALWRLRTCRAQGRSLLRSARGCGPCRRQMAWGWVAETFLRQAPGRPKGLPGVLLVIL